MNIPTPSETKKAKDQWIRYRLVTTDSEKHVRHGQVLIIRDDPQRHEGVMVASRNKVGAPFQHAESLLATLAAVKSMTGLPYRRLQGMPVETLGDWDTPCYTTAPDARHGEAARMWRPCPAGRHRHVLKNLNRGDVP